MITLYGVLCLVVGLLVGWFVVGPNLTRDRER